MAVSADALQIYRGLETLTGAATAAEQERLEHRLLSFAARRRLVQRRRVRPPRARGDRRAARRRPPADRRRRHRPVPARGARRARPAPARPGRGAGAPPHRPARARRARAPRRAGGARPGGGDRRPADRHAAARARARAARRRPRAARRAAAVDRRHPASHAARRPDDGARGAEGPDRRTRARDGGGRRGRRGPRRGGRRRLRPPSARRSGSRSCWPATSRRCSAARAATRAASSRGCASCPTCCCSTRPTALRTRSRPSCTPPCAPARHDPPVRFEKWQALGNDYLILERAALPAPLTPAMVQRLCDPHFGVGADGVLELSPPDEPGFVARLRIFNPDGSEAELSGNGAREAILYLRRSGWTDGRHVLDPDRGGGDPADDHRPDHLQGRHGPRHADLQGLPGRPARRHRRGRRLRVPARLDRQPAVRDPHRGPRRRSSGST